MELEVEAEVEVEVEVEVEAEVEVEVEVEVQWLWTRQPGHRPIILICLSRAVDDSPPQPTTFRSLPQSLQTVPPQLTTFRGAEKWNVVNPFRKRSRFFLSTPGIRWPGPDFHLYLALPPGREDVLPPLASWVGKRSGQK